ncbi:MAG: hypothetical protein WC877_00280 [Dehalococcoidales bacterium]
MTLGLWGIALFLFGLWYSNVVDKHVNENDKIACTVFGYLACFFLLFGVFLIISCVFVAIFSNEVSSSHNICGGTIVVVDDGKMSYVKDGASYIRLNIPYISKPLKFREYLIRGEEETEVPMDVVSSDGIPMTCIIDMKLVMKDGEEYNYEEIFGLAKSYGLGWPEYVAKEKFGDRYTEYAQIHTAEYLYRNGIYDPEWAFGSHNLYTLGKYQYKDAGLQEKIDDKIYEEYHSNDPKVSDFSGSFKQSMY